MMKSFIAGFAFVLVHAASGLPDAPPGKGAAAPKTTKPSDETEELLKQLVAEYQAEGLPVPPRSAELIIRRSGGGYSDKVAYLYRRALFRERQDGKIVIWDGCNQTTLDNRTEPYYSAEAVINDLSAEALKKYAPIEAFRDWHQNCPSHPDLAVAIQCQILGRAEQARWLLEHMHSKEVYPGTEHNVYRLRLGPEDDRKALGSMVWDFWSLQFVRTQGDRRPIIERLRSLLSRHPALDDIVARTTIADMEKTCSMPTSTPGSLESAVDSLTDLGFENKPKQQISVIDFQSPGFFDRPRIEHRGYAQLQEAGLSALPVLIEHLDDFRFTRSLAAYGSPPRIARVSAVVSSLLDAYRSDGFSRQSRAIDGRGDILDTAQVLDWWVGVQREEARKYLLSKLSGDQAGINPQRRNAVIDTLGRHFPDDFKNVIAALMEVFGETGQLMRAVGKCSLPPDSRLEILKAAAKHPNSKIRYAAIGELLRLQQSDSSSLLIAELNAALKPKPDSGNSAADVPLLAKLFEHTTDKGVWTALEAWSQRASRSQRCEMVVEIGELPAQRELVIGFLATILQDRSPLSREEIKQLSGVWNANRTREAAADQQCVRIAYSFIARLPGEFSAGDIAAVRLADLLEIETVPDAAWSADEWNRFHDEVKATVAEYCSIIGAKERGNR